MEAPDRMAIERVANSWIGVRLIGPWVVFWAWKGPVGGVPENRFCQHGGLQFGEEF